MSVSLQVLDAVIGAVDMGPAGFNITGRVSAAPAPGSNAVEVKIDPNNVDTAVARNNGGSNKEISKSFENGLQRMADGQNQHAGFLSKTGQDKTIDRVMGRGASFIGRSNLRSQQAGSFSPSQTKYNPAPPQVGYTRSQTDQRRTFDLAKRNFLQRNQQLKTLPKTKTVAVPQPLAQAALAGQPYQRRHSRNISDAYARNWAGVEGVFDIPRPKNF